MQLCHQCGATGKAGDRFCASCGKPYAPRVSRSDALVGRTIGEAYTLEQLIGVGGMGRVYRAEQSVLGRTVAVKVIHPHLMSDDKNVARFYAEARMASRLNHPNSVGIIDFGRSGDGILYLVMEYLNGKDLAQVMEEEGPLPFTRICEILIPVLDALSEAHAQGVVHRDLKPENIILKRHRSGKDQVKVVDFGLATILGNNATSITAPGLVCGTPDYMCPEQARGEGMDGRGDIYSLGVLLFELLTDRLPYVDETPTKVVLRHIHDPIPDPREVAPMRGIPDLMAEITRRALAKSANHRYQSAEEMQSAVRELLASLRSIQVKRTNNCASCGESNLPQMRFCGNCGARLSDSVAAPPLPGASISPQALLYPSSQERRFIARETELARVGALRMQAQGTSLCVRVVGEAGAGKTSFLRQIATNAETAGDVVAWIEPNPLGAPVPYSAAKSAVASLLDFKEDDLPRLAATEGVFSDVVVRSGLQELVFPLGLVGLETKPRIGAVRALLRLAIQAAAKRARTQKVVVIIDDLHRCDPLSKEVFADLTKFVEKPEWVLLTSSQSQDPLDLGSQVLLLDGIPRPRADEFFSKVEARQNTLPDFEAVGSTLSPLYLEQIEALGVNLSREEGAPLPRLADLVGQRLERLDLEARKLLQTASILGDRCFLDILEELAGERNLGSTLGHLQDKGWLRVKDDQVQISHPFVRDLIEASIPAEARKLLHQKALQVAGDRDFPLEVRAEHAYRTGDPMIALMLLERMGDLAMARGDATTAVLAFRRGLEVARRAMLETGDAILELAMVTFSRKLGEALIGTKDFTGADGVLREALDWTGPVHIDRARILVLVGTVAAHRDKGRDATRLLSQALEIASKQQDVAVETKVHLAVAAARHKDGDDIGAANAYRRALEFLAHSTNVAETRSRAAINLADLLLQIGDLDEARAQLAVAVESAKKAQAPALVAAAIGTLGSLEEIAGEKSQARQRYNEAAALAASAGDVQSFERWSKAAETIA